MKISASMIVKNEELVMQRCLDSLDHFADEIVIVDTGSTDNTKKIAKSHPKVRLYDSANYNKDTHYSDFRFNIARNESIDKCQAEWVFWMDADDFISPEDGAKIRGVAETSKDDVIYVLPIVFGDLKWVHSRMFRRDSGIRFDPHHSCHEYINACGRAQVNLDATIRHLPEKKCVGSSVRNLAILEKDYYERGYKDQRTLFYLANSYREGGKFDKAVEFYDKYLEVSSWREERYFANLYKARVLSFRGDYEGTCDAIYSSMIEDDRFAESYCLMGDILSHVGKKEKALHWYKMASKMEIPSDSMLFTESLCYNEYPREKIRAIEKEIGVDSFWDSDGNIDVVGEYCIDLFTLPKGRVESILALNALSSLDISDFKVNPRSKWQEELLECIGFPVLKRDGNSCKMQLPSNLLGIHKCEWYKRSCGFMGDGRAISKVIFPNLGSGSIVVSSEFENVLRNCEYNVLMVSDGDSVAEVVGKLNSSFVYIGSSGWISQLAAFFNITSIVFWENRDNFSQEGWSNQINIFNKDPLYINSLVREIVKDVD